MGKVIYLFAKKNQDKDNVQNITKQTLAVEEHREDTLEPEIEKSVTMHFLESDQMNVISESASSAEKAFALSNFARLSPDEAQHWPQVLTTVPEYLRHKNHELRKAAKDCIQVHSEHIAKVRPDIVPVWRGRVEDLLNHDRRTNRFVHAYPQTLDLLECLCTVGKWRIHEDQDELARFFLFLELESHIQTGRKEFSTIATEFLDFCGYSYFMDFYPNAVEYMLKLLEGECLPQWEKPYHKVFERLCKLRQHDRITQILLSAVVGGDLGRVDWFTRNLYPVLFETYIEYERALIELMASQSMPQEVRENALTSILFINEELLFRRAYFSDLVNTVRDNFETDILGMIVLADMHPRLFKVLTSSLRLVK